jgi:hypothetical protein
MNDKNFKIGIIKYFIVKDHDEAIALCKLLDGDQVLDEQDICLEGIPIWEKNGEKK